MSVYVDDARIPAQVGGIRGRWSHLISDSNDPGELAAFARRLGLAPEWVQHPGTHREHYDLTAGTRRAAIELGAVPITYPRGLATVLATKKDQRADGGAAASGSAVGRRVLVTGSRSWTDARAIRDVLAGVWGDGTATLVVGACPRGADALAEQCWRAWGGQVERHPADWTRYGRSAGYRRYEQMVRAGADVCVAFIRDSSPGSSRTAALAERAGIPVRRRAHPDDAPDTGADSDATEER